MLIHQGRCEQRRRGSNGWRSNSKPLFLSFSWRWVEQLPHSFTIWRLVLDRAGIDWLSMQQHYSEFLTYGYYCVCCCLALFMYETEIGMVRWLVLDTWLFVNRLRLQHMLLTVVLFIDSASLKQLSYLRSRLFWDKQCLTINPNYFCLLETRGMDALLLC